MASIQTTHPFTCNSCQVAFKSSELQRTHMQSDWHRYNLKRRVSSLPPLSSEIFAEKVLASKAESAATAARASFEKACEACHKSYFSENAFVNHLNSAKHKANVARLSKSSKRKVDPEVGSVMSSTFSLGGVRDEDDDEDSIDEEAEEEFEAVVNGIKKANINGENDPVSRRPTRPHHSATGKGRPDHPLSPANGEAAKKTDTADARSIALRECLFCNHYAQELKENLTHMTKTHGLFIPEQEYLDDIEGLVVYLNKKVYEEYQCLYCNRTKWSEDGIKQHMLDLGHCKIAYDSEQEQLEIGKFYDFRSTYSDGEEDDSEEEDSDEQSSDTEMKEAKASKLGARRSAEADNPEADEGWETDSTVSSVPTEELGPMYYDDDRDKAQRYNKLKSHPHHAHSSRSRHRAVDGWHSHAHSTPHAVYHDEFELHLPSGRIAGHRSNQRYFRQNLHSYPTAPEELERRQIKLRAISDGSSRQVVSRADGGLGMLSVSDAKKRQVKALEKKERRREGRMMARVQWQTDKKGNSQKHYRDPLLQ